MASIMMALGDFVFSIDTAAYQQLTRTTEWRWSSQDRIGRHAAMQSIGPGTDTIEVSGVIYATFKGGLNQLNAMRDELKKGEALDLMGGRGENFGPWVIKSIRENHDHVIERGIPIKQSFSMSLEYYGEDLS